MPTVTATEVKALRDATGAGMMDAKRALVENEGDFDAASSWLRERGLGKAAARSDRTSSDGAVAIATRDQPAAAAMVQLRAETDFVAKSPAFVALVGELAAAVLESGEAALDARKGDIDNLKVTLGENIEVGQAVRFEAAPGNILDTYLHLQSGRGVNAVMVELSAGSAELAHDIAVHIAFGRPSVIGRDEVPEAAVAEERAAAEAEARNEGKPEAALPKIVEGKVNGWYKRQPGGVLLDQPYAKDDKQSVAQVLGSATVVRFAQATIGG
ncbi:MAG: translation elongation factor Ts [Acidimicrobiales bacterium]